MATLQAYLNYAASKENLRVTVPSNPYGGQCTAYVDHLCRWLTDGKYNLAYTNAIDLLSKARANGFKVTYYTGANKPPVGAVWVTRTYGHVFGHTGIFIVVDGQIIALEQNVDGNWDALTNGGWVRRKQRVLYSDGTMNYNPWLEKQTLVGWFEFPLTGGTTAAAATRVAEKKGRKSGMYGSFIFTVKEGDGEFGKGTVYCFNAATNAVTGMHNTEELKYLKENYKKRYGEDMPSETFSTAAPTYRRLFGALGTDTKGGYTKLNEIKAQLAEIAKQLGQTEILNQLKEVKEDLADLANLVSGNDIAQKQKFTATVNLNIRKTASTTGEVVGMLKKGETVEIIGSAQADGYYWISFKRNNELVYVASKVVGGMAFGNVL